MSILEFLKTYFRYLGAETGELEFLNTMVFQKAGIMRLAASNVLPEIRRRENPESHGNQSHIAITGERRKIFFSEKEISCREPIEYTDREIMVSPLNIFSINPHAPECRKFGLKRTTMRVKLSVRNPNAPADTDVQVQLGQIERESAEFENMREGLHLGDCLAALKYRHSEDNRLFMVGIPEQFIESNQYELLDFEDYTDEVTAYIPPEGPLPGAEDFDGTDAVYQSEVQSVIEDGRVSVTYDNEPVPFNDGAVPVRESHRAYTNPQLGKASMEQNGFRCAFDTPGNPHETFTAISGNPYLEAHHLIPMAKQPLFRNRLDVISNIVPLCPTCHRKIHNGRKEDRREMMTALYEKRRDELQTGIGQSISLEELLSFYDID